MRTFVEVAGLPRPRTVGFRFVIAVPLPSVVRDRLPLVHGYGRRRSNRQGSPVAVASPPDESADRHSDSHERVSDGLCKGCRIHLKGRH